MHKEQISVKQGISLIALFVIGNSLILPTAVEAKEDLWISIIIAFFVGLPYVCLYARLHTLFPKKDLFAMLEVIFGKVIGKLLCMVFIWFVLSLGAAVLRTYGEFIVISDLTETPKTVPMVFLLALCIWGVKEGIEVLGRWTEVFVIFIIVMIFLTLLFLLPESRISNLMPILYGGFQPVIKGAWSVFAFPLAEVLVFSMVFTSFEKQKPYRIYSIGLFIGWITIFLTSLSELSILGGKLYTRAYFPSNMAVARLNIANFLQRMEIIPAVTLLIGGFVKMSICLMAVCRGVAHVTGAIDYRFIVIPVALMFLNISEWVSKTPIQMFEGVILWPYYAFPFEVVLPLIVWIGAEIRFRQKRQNQERWEG